MGQLVFQAALGGQVNLVGPNTASTINLNVPAVNGTIVTTGDTATVTSAMISGPITVAKGGTGLTSTPSNGQLDIGNGTDFTRATLTAGAGITVTNGSGSITIASTNASAPIGTDLSYVDYSLTTSSAINSLASANIYMQSISLDGTSELMIIYSSSSAHAVVWNSSTNTFGTPILVRTGSFLNLQNFAIAKISSTSVLVCSLPGGTALQTVVLTVSGSTITVGTALATTLAASSLFIPTNTRLVTVGSSYVLNYYNTTGTTPKFRAITVSGTTPSIGAELAYAGGTSQAMHHSYAQSASILLHFSVTASTTVFVLPITVSGTTLTAGTAATVSTTDPNSYIVTGALSNSRYALAYLNTTGQGAVVSVVGTVASISTAATTMAVTSWTPQMQVFSNQAFIATGTGASEIINVLTDTAGVASLGTDLALGIAGVFVGYLSTSKVFFASNTSGQTTYYQYGISSGSAVLEKSFQNVTSTTVVTVQVPGTTAYSRPLSGPNQIISAPMLRTTAGKIVCGSSAGQPFAASIDGTYPAKLQQSANPFPALNTYNDAISDAVCWGFPSALAASTTTVQLRKVTLA